MTDPLAVGTGDRVTFPDVLVAGDIGLIFLVNGKQVALPPFLVPGGAHRRVVLMQEEKGERYVDGD
jgi:hypothetical protein